MWVQNKRVLKLLSISAINDVVKTWNLLCKRAEKLENYDDRFADEARQDTLVSIRWIILKILMMMSLFSKLRFLIRIK